MDEVVREFVAESRENLQRMEHELVLLENSPQNGEILANIFRTIHTIKGTCGFFEFAGLETVTHTGENLLSKLRDRKIDADAEIISALLALVDVVRKYLSNIDSTGAEGDVDTTEIMALMSRFVAADQSSHPRPDRTDPSARDSDQKEAIGDEPRSSGESPGGTTVSTVRLDVGLLDAMMGLVGELVLVRNQIVEHANEETDGPLASMSQRLHMVTTRLQEKVMQTRMQPIDAVFSSLPRLVRDLALDGGKRTSLRIEGNDTELDRTIIEAIRDPLTHLVRNAVDHGIEDPAARREAGKAEDGRIAIAATHENGQVIISIADDGAGIDADRIRARAIELGLVDPEILARASDSDVLQLAFSPGLSTANRVTSVSGRGVGLDVVRNNIERIGGSIDLSSAPSEGTTVKIRLPMTLAIIQALMVRSRGQRFAIPQLSTMELVGLGGERGAFGIEHIHAAPVFRLRDKLLPIIDLGQELQLPAPPSEPSTGDPSDHKKTLVVVRANEREFGMIVDAVDETQEIVVKPLGRLLRRIPILAGTTILGDGRVALILDIPALAQRVNVITERTDTALRPVLEERPAVVEGRQALLLFASPDDGRMAIPLVGVDHLDTIERAAVERAGGLDVTQYRGEILPLITVSDALEERRSRPRREGLTPASDTVHVVIYSINRRQIGLVVDRVIDIVDQTLDVQQPGTRDCVLGTMIIRDRVTEILDINRVVWKAHPELIGDLPAVGGGSR